MNWIKEYHSYIEKYPRRIPETIKQRVRIDNEMFELFNFEEELIDNILKYMETHCYLVDGEYTEKIILSLPQKYWLSVILGFWGNIEEPDFDENGEIKGNATRYSRIVKDSTLVVASGFGKTTILSALGVFLMNSGMFTDPKIFIGSNSQTQSDLCFSTMMKMTKKSKYKSNYTFRPSRHEMENTKNGGKVVSMSREGDNYEGIQPLMIILDEIHAMKTSKYADDLKKSTKRTDLINVSITTQGTERDGYLDKQLEVGRNLLSGNTVDYTNQFFIYEQESIEEIIEAYENDDYEVLFKSNPNIGTSQKPSLVMNKIKELITDPTKKTSILTKNFNIPQNPETSLFTNDECITENFEEKDIIPHSFGFFGFDMALQMTADTDFAALTYLVYNPNTEDSYTKDIYFVPKWIYDQRTGIRKPHLPEKQKLDNVDYAYYLERGDIVELDCEYITEELIYDFIIDFTKTNNITPLKFGIDPAYCSKLITQLNANADDKTFCLPYNANQKQFNTPIIKNVKALRKKKKVYNNNKFTERQFATVQKKEDNNGNIVLTNRKRDRKDGVIAHMAAYSAYNVFISNKNTGVQNLENLKKVFQEQQEIEEVIMDEQISINW